MKKFNPSPLDLTASVMKVINCWKTQKAYRFSGLLFLNLKVDPFYNSNALAVGWHMPDISSVVLTLAITMLDYMKCIFSYVHF